MGGQERRPACGGEVKLTVEHKLTPREFDEIVALSKPKLVITEDSHFATQGAEAYSDEPLPVRVSSRWKIATSGGTPWRWKAMAATASR